MFNQYEFVSFNDDINKNLIVKEQSNVEKTTDTQQNQKQNSPVEGHENVDNLKEVIVQLKTTNDLLRFQNSMFVGVLGFFLICYLLYKVFFKGVLRYAL